MNNMASNHADAILDEARKRCDEAELFEEWGETQSVTFENNNLKRITARQFRGIGLRVMKGGRLGFASTTDLRSAERLVDMALESARFGEEACFEFVTQPSGPCAVKTSSEHARQVTLDEMVAMGRNALAMSRAADDEYLFDASLSRKRHSRRVMNSRGLDVEYEQGEMAASAEIKHVSDAGLLQVYEFKSWGLPFDSIEDITETALHKTRQALRIAPARMEVMPVIFAAKSVDTLLDPILTAASGKLVHKGASVLGGQIGKKILDAAITITDDPTIDYAPGSGPVDCEGVATRRMDIIKEGVLLTYLLDLHTAALLGAETTGHGYRNFASQPAPGSSNIVVTPGDKTFEAMIAELEQGVIVDQTLGAGQSNTLAGEFSVNLGLGFLVENGEIRGRVKDCMVAGNVYQVLDDVLAVGSEREWIGSDLLPPICVGGLKLAARE